MKRFFPFLFMLFFAKWYAFSQYIVTSEGLEPQELIERNFINGCAEVSNVSSSVNGEILGIASFGSFQKGTSNFPLESGIVLSTGSASDSGNTVVSSVLGKGDASWGSDLDLEASIGVGGFLNATSMEFDFVAATNAISFRYVFASEEYQDENACNASFDSFVFLIKELGTSQPYRNIALVPNSNDFIGTGNIRPDLPGLCAPQNEAFFEGFDDGATNFYARTKVLTATTSIVPNQSYRVKLVIADQGDQFYDSAVFLERNNFDIAVDLGADIESCSNEVPLLAEIESPVANYEWFYNGTRIDGVNTNQYNAKEVGNYRVRCEVPVGDEICVVEDAVNVLLNKEQTIESISDFILCDTNNSGDRMEVFDLTLKNKEISDKLSSSNYTISYYFSEEDSKSKSNQITAPFENTSSREKIFVRAENPSNGCLAFGSFFIQVNDVVFFMAPEPLEVCSSMDNSFSSLVNFKQSTETVQNGNTDLSVTYYESRSNALSGTNSLPLPYKVTGPSQRVYFRVENSLTSCFAVSNIDVFVLSNPNIVAGDYFIDGCELTDDGSEVFDITVWEDEILGGLTDVTTSYHNTSQDAISGKNAIRNTENYLVDNYEETVFIRVEDKNTGCFSIEDIELSTDALLTRSNIRDVSVCDDPSNDGIQTFDLVAIETSFLNGFENTSVDFFENQEQRDSNTGALDKTIPYENTKPGIQPLYIRINSATCGEIAEFNLVVAPYFELEPLEVQEVCDEDEDLQMVLDLGAYDDYASNGTPEVTVSYYLTENAANNALGNPISKNYSNTSNPQVVYARVENQNNCVAVNRLEIKILPGPTVGEPSDIYICDDDENSQDGLYRAGLDLKYKIQEITAANSQEVSVVFYTSMLDAETETNPILDPGNFETGSGNIYVRVTNTISNCFEITSFKIIISSLPVMQAIEPYQICASKGGEEQFLLASKDNEILSGQTGKEVLYFESEENADTRTNPIDKQNFYSNIANPQPIYVRIENTNNTSCYTLNSFEIEVKPAPIFNMPTDENICSNLSETDEFSIDFTNKINEITDGSSKDLKVTFHKSQTDANNNSRALPLKHTSNNSQTIYVRVETERNCSEIVDFRINVFKAPLLGEEPIYVICDEDYDGKTSVDLTELNLPILDPRVSNYSTQFFATESDLSNNVSISNPSNYEVEGSARIYVKVTNNTTGCFSVTPMDITVESPPAYTPVSSYEFCETSDKFVDLNEITPLFELSTSATVVYYKSRTDAELQTNGTVNRYQYQSTNETIYIRFEGDNGCFYIDEMDLIINLNPIFTPPLDAVACDEFGDGSEVFDFSSLQDTIILNGASTTDYTITYHNSEDSAINGIDILPKSYRAVDGQQIWFRVENNQTNCWSVGSFSTIVNSLPEVSLPSLDSSGEYKVCDEDYDGITFVDLTALDVQVLDSSNHSTQFFATESDLSNNVSISNPSNYEVEGSARIYVKVTDNTTGCFSVTPMDITVESPPAYTPVSSYEFCETSDKFVDLNEITPLFELSTSATVVYYKSRTDAELQTNGTVNRYQYQSTNETIYIRFEGDNGCFYIDEMDLIINLNPIFTPPLDAVACDEFGDGSEVFDFSSLQDTIILNGASTTDYTITYHNSEDSAINGIDILPKSYRAVDGQQIWFRVENNQTNCWSVGSFSTIVNSLPEVSLPSLDSSGEYKVCDEDYDGITFVDLTALDVQVLDSSNHSTQFFATESDLSNNVSISNPSNYEVEGSARIYVKVTNNTTGCFSVTPMDITVESPPAYTPVSSYEFCETSDKFVDLNEITPLFELSTSATVVYYKSRTDAELQTNGTVNRYQYQSTNETIYIRFEGDNGCFYIDEMDLIINLNPIFTPPLDAVACDEFGDGSEVFDFSSLQDTIILNGASTTDYTITYHNSEDSAINGIDILPKSYRAVDGQQIWFRVENNQTNCWSVGSFSTIVNSLPEVSLPSLDSSGEYKVCDEDYDGITFVDLTALDVQVLDSSNHSTQFFATESDLSNNVSISNPSNYEVEGSARIYVKVTNNTTGCFSVTPMDITVESPPAYTPVSSYEFCETSDKFVDLNEITPLFELSTSATVVYYKSRTDAELQTNGTVNRYQYQSTNETIYIRFEGDNGCFYIDEMDLIINLNPIFTPPLDAVACDEFGDGSALFDFSSLQDTIILNGASTADFTITYHNSQENSFNRTDILPARSRAVDGQQIWFRVENNQTNCWSVGSFNTIVNSLPEIDVIDNPTLCLDGGPLVLQANSSLTDTYEWSTGESSQSIEVMKAGLYFVKVTNEYGCDLLKEFTVNSAVLLGIDVFHFQQPSKVSIEISGNGNYEFQLDDGFTQTANVFEDVPVGEHSITIYESNGCGSISRNIFVLNYPSYFSPDGTLPYWHILGMENITGMTATKVLIYDRNGRLVGMLSENSQGWDGRDLNGSPLPATDYWFSADVMVDGNHIITTGNFSLLR